MKEYVVTIEIYHGKGKVELRRINVEAGNKRLAMARGLREAGTWKDCENLYKSVRSVDPVI